jgi:hypothetical protein
MSFNNLIALAENKGKLPDISRRYLLSKLFNASVKYVGDKDKAKLASNLANIATKTASLVATKTDPDKWERAKEQAKAKMGGKHSARAMQLATKIYKDNGGGYSGKEPSAKNNSMKKWTKQDWQTRPGTSEIAEKSDGSTSRYLPKKKWDSMPKRDQVATDQKKLSSDTQYVDNTAKAKVKSTAKYY